MNHFPPQLEGPRLAPLSGGPARQVIVFLHGYGADGHDLISIGHHWAPHLPEAAFVAPHAPEPCAMMPTGRQWFELTLRDPSEFWRGVNAAAPILTSFLEAELERRQLEPKQMALAGFSQGAMMALHVGLRLKTALACIVGYSGLLAGPEHLAQEIKTRPPVLLGHGTEDPVIPFQMMELAKTALESAQVPVTAHKSRGLGHGIDETGLALGLAHIREAFQLSKKTS